jgi:hypothetical protein
MLVEELVDTISCIFLPITIKKFACLVGASKNMHADLLQWGDILFLEENGVVSTEPNLKNKELQPQLKSDT